MLPQADRGADPLAAGLLLLPRSIGILKAREGNGKCQTGLALWAFAAKIVQGGWAGGFGKALIRLGVERGSEEMGADEAKAQTESRNGGFGEENGSVCHFGGKR